MLFEFVLFDYPYAELTDDNMQLTHLDAEVALLMIHEYLCLMHYEQKEKGSFQNFVSI